MIVGLDCTRIPKSKDDRNFVMVSSYNESCSKYYTNIQKSCNNSQIAPAGPLLISALKKYETMRKQIPEYIFIYRSGSSEKEKEFIMKYEVEQIIELLQKISSNIKLCFIVVNKKTEMKFFEGDQNPRAGTVIDQGCVNPFIYEFYIQSHYVKQGAATPTNFHVLWDQTGLACEVVQELSYQLCYYYFNWNGSIRVPAPLKYAEVCNKFVTSYMTSLIENEELKSTTYYI